MDLFQIETFLTVVREGSFSRAAAKLFRTQPAVSQTIRKLERELGESLFDRSSRDGLVTDAGRVLQDYAEKLLNMRGEAIDALHELRQMHRGHLVVSANEFTCLYLLPVLDDFRRVYPLVRVTVQRALASRIPNDVVNHNTELGLVSYNPSDRALRSVVVYADELAFVVPPKHPLARAREVNIRQLGSENFVAHNVSTSVYREKVVEAFRRRKVPLNMDVQLPSIEAIKRFVARGNGVALLPGICVAAEVARGDLVRIPVPELRFEHRIRAVYRRSSSLSHAARAFLSVAESYAREHPGAYLYQAER
jgi:DNA-binding transcriptional LysR family regulator